MLGASLDALGDDNVAPFGGRGVQGYMGMKRVFGMERGLGNDQDGWKNDAECRETRVRDGV